MAQFNPKQITQKLAQEALPPVLLIFGDEPQQKIELIDTIRRAAVSQGFSERQQLTVDSDFSWHQLTDATQTMSLFADKQYIELALPSGKPGTQGAKVLSELASKGLQDLVLLIHGNQVGKDVKNAKWFKQLSQIAWFCPIYELKGTQLNAWITDTAKQLGLQIDSDVIALIAEMSEGNLLATRQELEKLALIYPNQRLDLQQVQDAIVDQSRFNVFQFIDEVINGNIQKAVKILQRLESEGLEPNIILWSLINENRKLLACYSQLKQNGRINFPALRIWQTKQGMYQNALRRLDEQDLENMQYQLMQADSLLKSEVPQKPYVLLSHLAMLFVPLPVTQLSLY
ncbi:DNA polymerase III subunit delta [Agaribacter flavus]|uniref:DNA polymerase III subunit delta n=1 Tax=Agaribacter flavus TaxID=1902781 RepID=UPI0036724264